MITKIILGGGCNVGDELVLKASLERDLGKAQFIIGYKPKEIMERYKGLGVWDSISLFDFPRNIPKIMKYCLNSERIELGGGGMISYDLRVNFFLIISALLGKKVNVVQAGCVPLNQINKKRWLRLFTTKIMLKLCNDVSVRDLHSQEILKDNFNVKSRIWLDSVWTYPIKKVKKLGKKVAVNIKIINTTPKIRQLSEDKIEWLRKVLSKMDKKNVEFIYINPVDKKLIEERFPNYKKVQMPINVNEFIKKLSKYGTLISFRKHPFWIAQRLGLKTIPIVIDKSIGWKNK